MILTQFKVDLENNKVEENSISKNEFLSSIEKFQKF